MNVPDEKQESVQRNVEYTQPDANTLDIRLNPAATLEKVEELIRGGGWEISEENGQFVKRFVYTCIEEYKLSEGAIRSILRCMNMAINSHTIQGNMDEGRLDRMLYRQNISLADRFIKHLREWNITGRDADELIDDMMTMVEFVWSRTLEDKERWYNAQGIKTVEKIGTGTHNTRSERKGFFGG